MLRAVFDQPYILIHFFIAGPDYVCLTLYAILGCLVVQFRGLLLLLAFLL